MCNLYAISNVMLALLTYLTVLYYISDNPMSGFCRLVSTVQRCWWNNLLGMVTVMHSYALVIFDHNVFLYPIHLPHVSIYSFVKTKLQIYNFISESSSLSYRSGPGVAQLWVRSTPDPGQTHTRSGSDRGRIHLRLSYCQSVGILSPASWEPPARWAVFHLAYLSAPASP